MKILLVGVLDIEWSTNCSMLRALEKLGHEVVPFNYRTIERQIRGQFPRHLIREKITSFLRSAYSPRTLTHYFREPGRYQMNQALLATVQDTRFDLILLSKTDTVDFNLIPALRKYAPVWYFFMDPISQAYRINAAEYAKRANWSSATFSDVADYFKESGSKAFWITQGLDERIFSPEPAAKRYQVSFVGTRTSERLKYIRTLRRAGISVHCVGEGWAHGPLYNNELADLYRASSIVLNFCRVGSGFSIRVFQVMGCGAFHLSEYCPDLETLFVRGEHLDWFQGSSELIAKVQYYLTHEVDRVRIASAGSNFVRQSYSWDKIMYRLLRELS